MDVTLLGLHDVPVWLNTVSAVSLAIGVSLAAWTAVDVVRRPPAMAVMKVVWPITMLFGGLLWLWLYVRHGRGAPRGEESAEAREVPMRVSVAKGASHCGAGCALGDVVGESLVVVAPVLLTAAGLGTVFSDEMYARWVVDFGFAFIFGVALQYAAIQPMQHLPVRRGIVQALKADALSIASWQVGMYGVMAIAQLWILPATLGGRVEVASPAFWWMMQVAMLAGFATSYPVNWWLVRVGIKEAM